MADVINFTDLEEIVEKAIDGDFRMRVYPDGLVSAHIEDANDDGFDLPVNLDIPISMATGFKEGLAFFSMLAYVAEYESNADYSNPSRPVQFRNYRLVNNQDLPTPLTKEEYFDKGVLNLKYCVCGDGGSGGGSADPDFLYSGVGVTYNGTAGLSPVISTYRQRNVSGVALGFANNFIDVTFSNPISEIWGVNVTFLKANVAGGGSGLETPLDLSYLLIPTFVGPNITGVTVIVNKCIIPSIGCEFIVLNGGADQLCETSLTTDGKYQAAIDQFYPNNSIRAFSRAPAPPPQTLGSGSLLRIEHPDGKFFAAGFRKAQTYNPATNFIDIGNDNFYPLPNLGDTNTSYYLLANGPVNGLSITGTFQPMIPVVTDIRGNEIFSFDVSVFGKA